jgi:hypothetical protein
MNAYQLAEWLDCNCAEVPIKKWVNDIPANEMTDCADMLRRQQEHINNLDVLLDKKYQIIKELKKQPKELTNQEISIIRDEFLTSKGCDIFTFARAILRKAQEK